MARTTVRRFVWWGIAAVSAAGALFVALRPRPVPVDLATATRGPLIETIDHEGKTRVRHRYVVSAPVAGRVLRIDLRPGDRVVANQTVIAAFAPAAATLLDARSRAEAQSRARAAESALERTRAEREAARVQVQHADDQRDRARSLKQYGLMTTEQTQAAETDALARRRALDAADAAVDAALHDVEAARAMLIEPGTPAARSTPGAPTLTLRSPIDGVVLERHRESEAVVPQGESLVTVADPADIEVIADFLSADAVRMQPGMRALVDQWGGGAPIEAVVSRIEPSAFVKVSALGVEEQRVWVVMDFRDATGSRALGDGYRVEARVVVWENPGVLRVPVSSLFRRGDGWAVFADVAGRAKEVAVEVGHRDGTSAEIRSGLAEGRRLVIYPPDRVADGTPIAAR